MAKPWRLPHSSALAPHLSTPPQDQLPSLGKRVAVSPDWAAEGFPASPVRRRPAPLEGQVLPWLP